MIPSDNQDGFTLAEVLVALLILAVGSVALVGAMGTLIRSSVNQRGFSSTDSFAKSYVEAVEQKVATSTWGCSIDLTPAVAATTLQVTVTRVWLDSSTGASISNCATYAASRCPAESSPYPPECVPGAIRLTLDVVDPGGPNQPKVQTTTETIFRRGNA